MQASDTDTGRFADALLALAEASAAVADIRRELPALIEVLEEHEDLRAFLADPRVTLEGKRNAIEALLKEHLHPVLFHFLLILQSKGAIARLAAIADGFFDRIAEREVCVYGELLTPVPLAADRLEAIETAVGDVLGKRVSLTIRIENRLLGGVRVQVGDIVFDGTVDRQLESVHRSLLS